MRKVHLMQQYKMTLEKQCLIW